MNCSKIDYHAFSKVVNIFHIFFYISWARDRAHAPGSQQFKVTLNDKKHHYRYHIFYQEIWISLGRIHRVWGLRGYNFSDKSYCTKTLLIKKGLCYTDSKRILQGSLH